jgi:hypothetical protein
MCLPTMSSVAHTRSGRPPRPANPSLQSLAKKRTSTGKLRWPALRPSTSPASRAHRPDPVRGTGTGSPAWVGVHEKAMCDGSEPPKRLGNCLQGPAQFRADLDLVRDQFPAGGVQGWRSGWSCKLGVPEADGRLPVVRSGTFSGPQAEPLRDMRLSPRYFLQHLPQRPNAWT